MATAHFNSISLSPAQWIDDIKAFISCGTWQGSGFNHLEDAVLLCSCFISHEVGTSFMMIVSKINLAVKTHSLLSAAGPYQNLKGLYDGKVKGLAGCPTECDPGTDDADRLFNSVELNMFCLPKHSRRAWKNRSLWATQMPFTMDVAMDDTMDTMDTIPCRIKTKFQRLAEYNIAFPASHDRSENNRWTISERVLACNAPAITHMQDLSAKTLIKGYGAPIDVHPHELEITNKTQMIPYLSKEGSDNEQLYLNLQDAFADVFQWISDVVLEGIEGIEGTQIMCHFVISARPNATAATALSKEDENLLGALLARKKAALASKAEAEKSAMCKRVAAMLADEEDFEGHDLHGKKICLNGDDNGNNDNEDVVDNDDNADDGKNMIDHILGPVEISSDDQDNSVVPPLQALSDDNKEEEEKEEKEEDSSPKRVVDDNEVVRGTDCPTVSTSTSTMSRSPSIISLPKSSTAKPKLHSMACPINKCIASLAHKAMRLFTVTEKGFPNPLSCQSIFWDLLVKATAAENDSGLVDKMKEIQDDQMWKGSTQVKGELISKARISVPPTYGIKNTHKDKLSDMIYWIINSGAFINNSIDSKEKMSDTSQPWKNDIIKILFQAQ
ncbi:hypothetical protein SERLADRAFT_404488 [Serpula lacrymans var. lacrymans S7.9]|uniref:DUF6532 domain-containing protein n=1 Tax=Serpula lacrymans var. lacrymans (strain S7.9) TaxID=578457 RepID=F8NDH9_SERL9|nr:uncharacterized protein SERLADRAFT_404488 [Serpula lacrymans var. lacrymans S7.9]EGO30212.1 hypothetical protein SERLADRAFT_404488 [Serpula lacrymans var. lacrymans S7.9]